MELKFQEIEPIFHQKVTPMVITETKIPLATMNMFHTRTRTENI